MNRRGSLCLVLVIHLLLSGQATADAPMVAYVYSTYRPGKDKVAHDAIFDQLGWPHHKWENVRVGALVGNLDRYDLLLFHGICNLGNPCDFKPYRKQWNQFLNRGGVIVVAGPQDHRLQWDWVADLGDGLRFSLKTFRGFRKTSDWSNPNAALSFGAVKATWAQFETWDSAWTVTNHNALGKPIVMYQQVGRGLFVVSTSYLDAFSRAEDLSKIWSFSRRSPVDRPLRIEALKWDDQAFGKKKVAFAVHNAGSQAIEFDAVVTVFNEHSEADPQITRTKLGPGDDCRLALSYVLTGGDNEVSLIVRSADSGNIHCRTGTRYQLLNPWALANDLERQLGAVQASLAKLAAWPSEIVEPVRQEHNRITARAEALTIELATQDADIAACCDRITAMNTEARLLAAKTATWQSLRELPKPDVRFIARAAESLDKVYRDRKWPESTAATLNAEMAANEYESVQLVIVPLRGKLNDVQVRCGSLRSGDAVITDVEARPVADVFLPIAGKHGGWRPDVLLGAADFDVPTDRAVQAVWITIHTQPDTVAGRYSGVVTVSAADSTSVTLPITVTVWGFAVPHKRNLPTQFHFRPNQIAAYYFGPKARGEYWKHLTATMYRRLMTSLLRYRIGVHPYDDREGQSRSATAYLFEQREGNKVTALDFVEFDRNTQLLLDHGVDLLYAGCFLHQKMSGDSGEYWRSFMPKMYEHLQARGWDKSAFVYGYDEFPPAELADVREQYAVVKELAPTVKYLLTYYKPDCAPAADDPGYADIWVPSLGLYSPQLAAERKRHGQTTWAYVVPGFEIYRSNRDYRRLFRTIWQQRCAGFLYFCTAFLHWNPRPADLNADGSPRKTFLRPGKGAAGIYHLCYPAGAIPEDGLNASIRLEAIRDGLEDWEYFNLLKDLIERAPQPDDQLVETARQVMRQVDDPSDKTDPASQRRAVARMIELLSR